MADPGSLSATIAQISTTSGTGPYTLTGTILDKLPFAATGAYNDGDTITYHVTDSSGQVEVTTGIFTSPDQLSRVTLLLSSTGSFISWPVSGQRIVTPLTIGIPICDTPPTDGQALLWDAMLMEWCPGDVMTGSGPDDDTCDMIDVDTGTSI